MENPPPPGATRALYDRHVLPTYGRFPLTLVRGEGTRVWDDAGRAYLDFTSGIAVTSLGHCPPALVAAIRAQAGTLLHVSNLFHTPQQAQLAERLTRLIGLEGRIFFCNSGAEANDGLYKLARRFGSASGRYEIITTERSFHGRTLAGIAATGQAKVKQGFEPLMPGFRHVPFGSADAVASAINDTTAAVLVEPIQGEGGVYAASAGYLNALRQLCDEHGLLLLYDEIQCGLGRAGDWCGWKAVGAPDAIPDGISWAKGLGGGFPIGAFWVRDLPLRDGGNLSGLLGPGSHGTTYGGSPLACAAALAVLEAIEKDDLPARAARLGRSLRERITSWRSPLIRDVRGHGLLIGIEIAPLRFAGDPPGEAGPPARRLALRLIDNGLLVAPAGDNAIRLLPPLTATDAECGEALDILRATLAEAAGDAPR